MISIIVSTYKEDCFAAFCENVKETIGVEYEIIKIENKGQFGLCEAYNIGKAKAKYPFVCFSHDDIKINTINWGQYIVDVFLADKKIGLLGIAGSGYKPWMPSAWFFSGDQRFRRLNITQTVLETGESSRKINNPNNIQNGLDRVTILDGCWFCSTKEIVDEFDFDQKVFQGFHCYDLDYSLQVGEKYDIAVSFDLNIEHFSYGSFSGDWLIETFRLHDKWKDRLPQSTDNPSKDEIQVCEFHAYCFLLSIATTYSVNKDKLKSILFSKKAISLVGFTNWLLLIKYTFFSKNSKK